MGADGVAMRAGDGAVTAATLIGAGLDGDRKFEVGISGDRSFLCAGAWGVVVAGGAGIAAWRGVILGSVTGSGRGRATSSISS